MKDYDYVRYLGLAMMTIGFAMLLVFAAFGMHKLVQYW